MRLIVVLALWCFLSPSSSDAQGRSAAGGRASIEGDAYLVMKSGDTKRGAGNTIYLIPDNTSLRLDLASTCQSYHLSADPLERNYRSVVDSASLAKDRDGALWSILVARASRISSELSQIRGATITATRERLEGDIVDSAATGVNAHYRFSGVRSGRYVVFGKWTIGDHTYVWFAPIQVPVSGVVTRDLDNSVEVSATIYCGA